MVRFRRNSAFDGTDEYDNLHSNMVRFRPTLGCFIVLIVSYLHSNMVRFRRGQRVPMGIQQYIYIPIWLDFDDKPKSIIDQPKKFTFQYG